MERLLAYAYLLCENLISMDEYETTLNKLFLENPSNADLLELEIISNNKKSTIAYIKTHIDYNTMSFDIFGRELFKLLKPIYHNKDLKSFSTAMYSLWESLAGNLQEIQPFWTLSYADEPLSWGDVEQTKKIYEKMLSYYDEDSK